MRVVSYTHTRTHTQVTDASVHATRSTLTEEPASTMPLQESPSIDRRAGAPQDRKSMIIRHGDPSPEGLGETCILLFAYVCMHACMHEYLYTCTQYIHTHCAYKPHTYTWNHVTPSRRQRRRIPPPTPQTKTQRRLPAKTSSARAGRT